MRTVLLPRLSGVCGGDARNRAPAGTVLDSLGFAFSTAASSQSQPISDDITYSSAEMILLRLLRTGRISPK